MLYMKNTIVYILIAFLPTGYSAAAQTTAIDYEKKIDSLFAEYKNTPGVAVAVVKNGAVVFKKGYGMANLGYEVPITPQTKFHIASVSKQFTAFSVYLLKKQGKISLEDDIRKYIPELPVYNKTIRIKHLLGHTSGLRDQWAILTLAGWQMEDVISTEHILKLAARQKALNFEPGTRFGYCNTGYTLLAEAVSRISGQSFAAFTAANIFQPLGMVNTVFYDDLHTVLKNRAHSYELGKSGYTELKLNYSNVGATSLTTTVEDLAKWVNNFKRPVVGDEELMKDFNAASLLDNGDPVTWAARPGDTIYHAKGQLLLQHKGVRRISHGGHDAGFRSALLRFPDSDLAVITLSNNEHYSVPSKTEPIADMYLGDEIRETVGTTAPTAPAAPAKTVPYTNTLADFEGAYYSHELATTYHVKVKGDQLLMTHYRLSDMELEATAKDSFSGINSFAFQMVFTRDRQRVVGFEISNFGAKNVAFKKQTPATAP